MTAERQEDKWRLGWGSQWRAGAVREELQQELRWWGSSAGGFRGGAPKRHLKRPNPRRPMGAGGGFGYRRGPWRQDWNASVCPPP